MVNLSIIRVYKVFHWCDNEESIKIARVWMMNRGKMGVDAPPGEPIKEE